MLKLGDICPLFFSPMKDKFFRGIDYIQKFYTSDVILIQMFATEGETISAVTLYDVLNKTSETIRILSYTVNSSINMYYVKITGLSDSVYTVSIAGGLNIISEPFCVTSSTDILESTSLLQCSHRDNNSAFDNIFWIEDDQQFIQLRLECGFRPSGVNEKVDIEQFRDQMQSVIQLYSVPYQILTLSCGDAVGLPIWYGKAINRMLCVSDFKINGTSYVRSEDSVPEKTQVSEDSQMFWFTVLLETLVNNIAGVGGEYATGGSSGVLGASIILNNVTDGEVLRYSEVDGAFVNTNTIDS